MCLFWRVFNLSCGRVVYKVEKSKVLMEDTCEKDLDLKVIKKMFRVFQNPHVIYATTRVNSFTIFLLSLFHCRQNLCQVNRQFFRRTSWWTRYVPFFVWSNILFIHTIFSPWQKYFICDISSPPSSH